MSRRPGLGAGRAHRKSVPLAAHVELAEDETFDDLIAAFSERYAERTTLDHAQLVAAIADGSVEAVRDL